MSEEQRAARENVAKGCRSKSGFKTIEAWKAISTRILSLGMFEHVGPKNYGVFMRTVRKHLKPEGLFLLGTIGKNRSTWSTDPWLSRYIFPNSAIPSAKWISRAVEGLFVIEDWQNFGAGLRPDPHGLVRQLPSELESDPRKIWRAISPHVGVLSLLLHGRLSCSTNPDVADIFFPNGIVGGYHAASVTP